MIEPPSREDAKFVEPSAELHRLAREVVDAAFMIHTALGPGLLESAYEQCFGYELEARGIPFQRQVVLPPTYRNRPVEAGYRLDILIGRVLVVEIKAVEKLLPVHDAQ